MLFAEIVKTLESIRDAEFVCNFCTSYVFPTIPHVKHILVCGGKRTVECSGTLAAKKLLLTRKKFLTFEKVLPTASIERWVSFVDDENSMFSECLWFLEQVSSKIHYV